jgi:hypothetical protein
MRLQLLLLLALTLCAPHASSGDVPLSGSVSLALSSSIATAGAPLSFSVSSTDENCIVCVQVLNSSRHVLHSFAGSRQLAGVFAVDAASRHSVACFILRSGGLSFSRSAAPFNVLYDVFASPLATIRSLELPSDDVNAPFAQWAGMLHAPCSGDFYLNLTSTHACALRINSTLLFDNLHLRAAGLFSSLVRVRLVEGSLSDVLLSCRVVPHPLHVLQPCSHTCNDAGSCAGSVFWKLRVALAGALLCGQRDHSPGAAVQQDSRSCSVGRRCAS